MMKRLQQTMKQIWHCTGPENLASAKNSMTKYMYKAMQYRKTGEFPDIKRFQKSADMAILPAFSFLLTYNKK